MSIQLGLKKLLIYTILIISVVKINAQVDETSTNLAIHYEANNQIDAALKEYLKLYLYSKNENQSLIPMKIGDLFIKKRDANNAVKYYDIQYNSLSPQDPLREEIRYLKIKTFLVSKNFKKAKAEILQLQEQDAADKNKYLFYKGFIYYLNDDFVQGLNTLSKIDYLSFEDRKDLNGICKKLIKNSHMKSEAYQLASGIIPGMGQFIAGDYKSGINSTILNGSLIYLFFAVADRLSYSDAFVSVGPWLSRYFIGGVGNARESAVNKKIKKAEKYIHESLKIISNANTQKLLIPTSQ